MDSATTQAAPAQPTEAIAPPVAGAEKMTLLELNKIRLDMQHTVLTPQYLESLDKGEEKNPAAAAESGDLRAPVK